MSRCPACQEIADVLRYGAPPDIEIDDEREPDHTCGIEVRRDFR